MYRLLAACALMVCGSCNVNRYTVQISQSYDPPEKVAAKVHSKTFKGVSYDRVWEAIISFFATRQISIDTLEKESGIVVAKRMVGTTEEAFRLVSPGTLVTSIWKMKQSVQPSHFNGSLNPEHVFRTGRVLGETRVGDIKKIESIAQFRMRVGFNVFVRRFGEKGVSVQINASFDPVSDLELVNGWCGYWHEEYQAPMDMLTVLSAMKQVSKAKAQVSPRSTGEFEGDFIRAVTAALDSK
jgi:hypothetical protein